MSSSPPPVSAEVAAQALIEGSGSTADVEVDVRPVRAGFMMSSRSDSDGSPRAATQPAPQLRRLKSGQVTIAAEGKTVLESISFDHGEETHGDRKLEAFKWALLVLCGLLVGFVGWALVQIEHYFIERKINSAQDAEIEHGAGTGTAVHVGISVGMIMCAALLVVFVGPLAQGSGIPLILAYLNGNQVPNFLSPRTFFTKFVGLIFSISGGLPIGIEGPFIHIGALCANFVSLLPQRLGFTGRYARDVARSSSLRRMVACGGAAGVAAAFNAPIAGVLIIQQEAGAFWNADVTLRSFVCCTAASFSLNLLLNGFGNVMHGHTIIDFKGTRDFTYHLDELPMFLVLGVLGGCIGGAFTAVNTRLAAKRDALLAYSKALKLFETAVLAVIIALIAYGTPRAFGCVDSVSRDETGALNITGGVAARVGLCTRPDAHHVTACRRHGCAEGQYNPLASLTLNAAEPLIGTLFEVRPDVLSAGVLATFSVMYFVMLCIAYDASAVGGLFVPAMMIGASSGRCLAVLLRSADWPVQPSVFALVGAAAVMGGITRYSLAIVVLMIEATQNTSLLPPICIAVVVACGVANFLTHSINEHKLHRIGVPLIEDEMEHEMYHLFAADVMRRRVLTVRRYARVDKVYAYLLNTTHHGFPVVEHESTVMERLRSTSVATLKRTGMAAAESDISSAADGSGESSAVAAAPGERRAKQSPAWNASSPLTFEDDIMMHSLNAGSLRDDDQFHVVPTAKSVFKAGEMPTSSQKKKKSSSSPSPARSPAPRRIEELSSVGRAPEEWHSPAHIRREDAAAEAAGSPSPSRPTLGRGMSSFGLDADTKNKVRSHFTGMVTRAQLIHALATREKHANIELAHHASEIETAASHAKRLREELCAEALHDQGLRELDLTALDIQPQHHEMLIDLGPYIDNGVLSVAPNTPLGRVHRLFSSCGLRHLVVTDTDNEVSGIITRKDLTMKKNTVAFPQERPLVPASVVRRLSRRTPSKNNDSASVGRLQSSLNSIKEDQASGSATPNKRPSVLQTFAVAEPSSASATA